MCPSEREADVFLLVMGELGWSRVPRAVWHWLTCPACRGVASRMRRASARFGPASASKVLMVKLGTVAVASVTLFGMWTLGREAVGAAMTAMERPQIRTTTHEPEPGLPMRPNER